MISNLKFEISNTGFPCALRPEPCAGHNAYNSLLARKLNELR